MLDWNRINELKDEIGEEDFADVVVLFLAEVDEVIDQLKADIDLNAIESQMHFLKGSALNLGFSDVASLCQTGETLAKSGAPDKVDITPIINSYEQSKRTFDAGEPA